MKTIFYAIILTAVWYVIFTSCARAETTDSEMIKRRDVKSWIDSIENSITPKEKICVLGTTFVFDNVEIADGKLVLFYVFDEKNTYCTEVLHGDKGE